MYNLKKIKFEGILLGERQFCALSIPTTLTLEYDNFLIFIKVIGRLECATASVPITVFYTIRFKT